MSKLNLEKARINYTVGTRFISATKNVKSPLSVSFLKVANHFDRAELIKSLEEFILVKHNFTFPKRFKNKYNKIDFSVCSSFLREIEKEKDERDYLISLEFDIVEDSGGVIYCGENKEWAKIV